MARMIPEWFEAVSRFGPEKGLVGIVTHPREPRPHAPVVLLLNSGIIHRVGSNRVSVLLARELAKLGVRSLRFDLSGIGDSERRLGTPTLRQSVERDIADAIHLMASDSPDARFILAGLCSGAFDAFHSSLAQPMVVGALMVDLPGPFRGRHHTLYHLRARLFRVASWRNPLRKLFYYCGELLGRVDDQAPTMNTFVPGGRGRISRERMADHMRVLLERGVQLAFVFTAGLESNYNHRSQFAEVFPGAVRHPGLSHTFFPEADHAFSTHADRSRLVGFAIEWISRNWLGAQRPADSTRPFGSLLASVTQRVASVLAVSRLPD